jgi:hypothetical protein
MEQAAAQLQASKGTPLHWHVAERELAEHLTYHFKQAGLGRIKVIHTPPD